MHKMIHYERVIMRSNLERGDHVTTIVRQEDEQYFFKTLKGSDLLERKHEEGLWTPNDDGLFGIPGIGFYWSVEDLFRAIDISTGGKFLSIDEFIENRFARIWLYTDYMCSREKFLRVHWEATREMARFEEYMEKMMDGSIAIAENMMYTMYSFRKSGEKIFKLSHSLLDILDHMDYDLPANLIKLPFRTVFFLYPAGYHCMAHTNVNGKTELDEGVYVTIDSNRTLITCHTFKPNRYNAGSIQAELVLTNVIDLSSSDNISDKIKEFMSKEREALKAMRVYDDFIPSEIGENEIGGDEWHQLEKTIEIIIKTILYLSCPQDAMIKEMQAPSKKPPPKKVKKIFREKSRKKYTIIGDINVPASVSALTKAPGTGTKHKVRYWVRGHWHSYWMHITSEIEEWQILEEKEGEWGERWVKVRKFVKPYLRGPEFGKLVSRDYKVVAKKPVGDGLLPDQSIKQAKGKKLDG